MAKPLVLMGFAEALSAPEVAWSLADCGYRVLAFGRRGRTAAVRHSRNVEFYEITPPEVNLAAAAEDLLRLMESLAGENAGKTLFPLDDASVLLCGMVAKSSTGWCLAGPVGPCEQLALNKEMQTTFAREAGFHVPTTWLVRSTEEALQLVEREPLPMILRPVECVPTQQGRIQKGRNWICATRAEFESAVKAWGGSMALLVQPYITGTGEGVFGLATDQGVQAWSAHRRLRMMNPHGSGSSACISQAVDAATRTHVEALIQKSGWRGLFMVELLRDDAGKVWFVEMNGRPWGSMALARRQGLEYPAWQVGLARGEKIDVHAPLVRAGVVCRHMGRELVHLLFVLRGPKSQAVKGWPSIGSTLRQVFGIRRGDGIYNWRRHDLKVFFADFYNTVHDNLFKARG